MIFRSRTPEVAIPDLPYPDLVLRHAHERADQPVLIDGPTGRALTLGLIAAGVRRVASGLARRGLAKGDIVAIYSPNLREHALAFHGSVMAGGIVTTANPLYTPDELRFQLRDTEAKFLVTVPPSSTVRGRPPAGRRCARSSCSARRRVPPPSPRCSPATTTHPPSRSIHRPASRPCPTRAAPPAGRKRCVTMPRFDLAES